MLIRVRHIGLVLAGMAVAWAMGVGAEGACTVGACSRGTGSLRAHSRVQEARRVVAEADSLRAVGVTYSDSAAMAQAASSLEWVRVFYPTDYAHAKYYLGRILRNSGDHPAAMEAFLRVTHSRTSDHTIKGRAYSNIGTMCHLASNYPLSYKMYELCAEQFLLAEESYLYYYALNNMAMELAEDSLKDEAIALTNKIEYECTDEGVQTKLWETRANAYLYAALYDSVIYCVNKLHAYGYDEVTGQLLLARAFENLGMIDSALFYAKQVLEMSDYYGDKYNALYILSHYDSTLSTSDILSLTSEREDVRFDEYEPVKVKLTQAIQLLEQDLNRKPDLRWLWATIATLLIIAVILCAYIIRKRHQHKLYSQQVDALLQKKDTLSEQTQQMEQRQAERRDKALAEIDVFCHSITMDNIKETLCWKEFDSLCAIVNRRMFGLVDKLIAKGITNEKEIRICVLVAIGNFDNSQMASILPCGYNSFKTTKSAVAGKLITTGRNMHDFLLKMAVGD